MKNKSLNHIKKCIINMPCEDIPELQDFMTIGEPKDIKRGEGSSVIRPPIELSPRMVSLTEKNMSVCFKTKTESAYMTGQKRLLSEIRRDF